MGADFGKQCAEVLAAELPLERASNGAVVILEAQQAVFDFSQGVEVVGREYLALEDGAVHLDLIEPAGVHRSVHRDDRGPASLQAPDARLTAVRGAVVHDPEHARGGAIGFLPHNLGDEAAKGTDPGRGFAAAKDLGAPDIPGGQIGPGTAPLIFVLHAYGAGRRWRQSGMDPAARLDAGLLVRGEDAVRWAQGLSFPFPVIQVQHSEGLALEGRIARENPGAMRPRADCILGEPAPQGGLSDRGDQAALDDLAADLRHTPARQRHLGLVRQLAGQGLNGDEDAGGKSAPGAQCGSVPPGPADALGRSACATC